MNRIRAHRFAHQVNTISRTKYRSNANADLEYSALKRVGISDRQNVTGTGIDASDSVNNHRFPRSTGFSNRIHRFRSGVSLLFQNIANQRQDNEITLKSEQQIRMMLEIFPFGVVVVESNHDNFKFANTTLGRMLGYSVEEILRLKVSDIHPEESYPEVLKSFDRMMRGEISYAHNIPVKRKDGVVFAVDIYSSKLEFDGCQCVCGVFCDISDQQEAEAKIVRAKERAEVSEQRLKQAQTIANLGYWELDLIQNKLAWSDEVYTIFGCRPKEFKATYQAFLEFIHPEDREMVNQAYIKHLQTREDYDITHRVLTKQQEIRYVHERCRSDFDAQGNAIRSMGIVADITDMKLTELALQESEERFRNILNVAPVGIAVSQDQKIVFINLAGRRLLGAPSAEKLVGMDVWSFIHPDYKEYITDTVQQLIKGDNTLFPIEIKMVRFDGDEIDIEIIASLLTYNYKPSIQIILTDIMERKRHREELERLNNDLENRVEMRTAQLSEANREMEAFCYSVSHDLRAPLRGISGFTSILLEDYSSSLDEDGKRVCTVIRENVKKMGQLIDDLLSFSRLARQEISHTKINMESLIRSIFEELTIHQINPVSLVVDGLKDCNGDINMMKQALVNLLANAIKFSSKSEKPEIRVYCQRMEHEIVYYIRDNGVGFDMRFKDKLFGIFQRLHRSHEFEGTGVGLAIVQRIVQRHGGQVGAESELGKWATFWFSIPDSFYS